MFGPILGPILSGLILAHLSWRWLFLLNLPIGVAALALAIRFVPPMERAAGQEARPLDVTGLLLLSPGFAALVYALSQAANAGFGATRVVVALLAGAALLAGYTWHALTTGRPPLIDLRLFSRRGFAASV